MLDNLLDFLVRSASASAQSVTSTPLARDQIVPTLVMIGVACLGGAANFVRKLQTGAVRAFNITELVGELFISAVAGMLAWAMFKGFGVNEWLAMAGVGIIGHMGPRGLFLVEKIMETRAKSLVGLPPADADSEAAKQ